MAAFSVRFTQARDFLFSNVEAASQAEAIALAEQKLFRGPAGRRVRAVDVVEGTRNADFWARSWRSYGVARIDGQSLGEPIKGDEHVAALRHYRASGALPEGLHFEQGSHPWEQDSSSTWGPRSAEDVVWVGIDGTQK
jgi:hypothetical protein